MLVFLGLLSLVCGCPFQPKIATDMDKNLAMLTKHGGRVGGKNGFEIAVKINKQAKMNGWNMQPCGDFSLEELNGIIKELFCHHSKELQDIYERAPASHKDGRMRRFTTIEEYEKSWARESQLGNDDDTLTILRDAKCAEVLMHWTHHVPAEAKNDLLDTIRLPMLPIAKSLETFKAHVEAKETHVASFSCLTGHGMNGTVSDHQWPHWPEEVHYYGTGYGAYPFWLGPSGQGGNGPLEVWYSEKQSAERYYHHSCGMKEAGYSSDVPCIHLFVGKQPSPAAYLYTASGDFCCVSGPQGGGRHQEKLAPPATDFMDFMDYQGEVDFTGPYYKGKVKYYLLELPRNEPVTWFWYMTDLDGHPVQQGEGGKNEDDDSGAGIQIYHSYNTSSFKQPDTPYNSSMFAVPSICTSTTKTCYFP